MRCRSCGEELDPSAGKSELCGTCDLPVDAVDELLRYEIPTDAPGPPPAPMAPPDAAALRAWAHAKGARAPHHRAPSPPLPAGSGRGLPPPPIPTRPRSEARDRPEPVPPSVPAPRPPDALDRIPLSDQRGLPPRPVGRGAPALPKAEAKAFAPWLPTLREFAKRQGIQREGGIRLSLVTDPNWWSYYKKLAVLLLEWEYIRIADRPGVDDAMRARVVLSILKEATQLAFVLQQGSWRHTFKPRDWRWKAVWEVSSSHSREQQLASLATLAQQGALELQRVRYAYMSRLSNWLVWRQQGREALDALPLMAFAELIAVRREGDALPPHMLNVTSRWKKAEILYSMASLTQSTSALVSWLSRATQASQAVGTIACFTAPLAILFDAHHWKTDAELRARIGELIDDSTRPLGDRLRSDTQRARHHDEMHREATRLSPQAFAERYGGKVDWPQIERLKRAEQAHRSGGGRRAIKMVAGVVAAAAAVTVIVVSLGGAAVIITGVGIAAAATMSGLDAAATWEWYNDFDRRWLAAECLLEAARGRDRVAVELLLDLGLLNAQQDLQWLEFSDGFLSIQSQLAQLLGASG